MANLFLLLFMISLVLMITGLVAPQRITKHVNKPVSRKELGIWLGLTTLVTFFLAGVTAPQQASINTTAQTSTEQPITSEHTEKAKLAPIITKETETATEAIPFTKTTVYDASRKKGTSVVTTAGVNGVKTLTYEVTYTDGVETGRTKTGEAITTAPVNEVTSIGTREESNCDPNYSGACVPIASDVDCAGGSGNGPAYVSGPVYVIGYDKYLTAMATASAASS
jgi:resuscitation-promoting factor RpfB